MTSTLADLQRRNLEKMGDKEPLVNKESSVLTEVRKPVDTEISKPALAEARQDVSAGISTEASKSVLTEGRKPARKPAVTDTILARVEEALASREPLTGGVKATVDMSPELSSRTKRYLADHRGQNSRQVIVALLDAFLTEKGY